MHHTVPSPPVPGEQKGSLSYAICITRGAAYCQTWGSLREQVRDQRFAFDDYHKSFLRKDVTGWVEGREISRGSVSSDALYRSLSYSG